MGKGLWQYKLHISTEGYEGETIINLSNLSDIDYSQYPWLKLVLRDVKCSLDNEIRRLESLAQDKELKIEQTGLR
jgi:hypothetical protein